MTKIDTKESHVNPICDMAQKYLEMGLAVIPTRRKRPILRRWRDYQRRFPTKLEWDLWCILESDGIGLVLGEATWRRWGYLWVLDIEAPYRHKAEAWLGDVLHRTAVAESISGGLHVYFLSPHPIRSSRFEWGDILGQGRIVILPPSGWDGRAYRWIRPLEGAESLLRAFPESLGLPGFHPRPPEGNGREYEAVLRRQCIPEGQRNDVLTSFLGFLWQTTTLTPDEIWRVALHVNGHYFKPPLPLQEVRVTWRSIMRYERAPSPRPIGPDVKERLNDLLREAGIRTAYNTPLIVEIDDSTPCDMRPVAQLGTIPLYPGELVVLSGMPGSGKSTLLMTHMPEGALLLETDFDAPIAAWLRKKLNVRTRFRFAYVAANPSGLSDILQSVEESKNTPAIFIDTIQGVSSDPDALDQIVQYVRDFATRTGIPVVVASHENRRDASPLERIQGTLRLAQEASLVLRVVGSHKSARRIHVLKDRYAQARNLPPSWEWGLHPPAPPPGAGNSPPRSSRNGDAPSSPGDNTPKGVGLSRAKEILDLLQARGPMSAADVARALGYSRQHAQRLLGELRDAGEVQIARPGKRGRGHATLYVAKMHIPHGYVISEESTPQESASDLENVPNVHFTSATEADSPPKMHMGSENAHEGHVHFSAYSHADLRPKMHMAGIYNTRVPPKTEAQIGQGVGVSQGENETRPEPDIGSGIPARTESMENTHACPPEEEADDDFPIWAIWTIEMPNTRKGGACPFHDCPYHKPLTPKDPWSWLL